MADHEHDGMKRCAKCGEWKPATAEYFNRDNTMTCGLRSMCKVCRSEYNREHHQKNKDHYREYDREYYQKNKDRLSEYYQKNKDRKREYDRDYRQKNKNSRREYCHEYRQTPVGRLVKSIGYLREKTGATIYVRDMTEEQKETLANQYVAVRTLEKTEKELLATSGKKRCSMCDRVLDYEMFYKKGVWYKAACKACEWEMGREYKRKYNREYHQQNRDKINEYNREQYKKKQKST